MPTAYNKLQKYLPTALALFISFVFIQSLFYKFTSSPETLHIFGTLDNWGASLGFAGLFLPPGIFNYYVVGSAELVASVLLLLGTFAPKLQRLQPIGALLALGVISGAIFFHLFTPLGIEVQGDGGTLFVMACGVWASALVIIIMRRHLLPIVGNNT